MVRTAAEARTKINYIRALRKLVEEIEKAEKIDFSSSILHSSAEMREKVHETSKSWVEREPTGWMTVIFSIRLKKGKAT